MPKSYTPNWFFTALLDNHINQMMARYSCLRALRMDFFYRKDTPDFLQPDHRWLELQLRMLLEQVEQSGVDDVGGGANHAELDEFAHPGEEPLGEAQGRGRGTCQGNSAQGARTGGFQSSLVD